MMTSVLFENHHLYYLPHFLPIVAELRRRSGYRIAASISRTVHPTEQEIFAQEMANLGIEFITGESEEARTSILRKEAFDVVIVGNVGRLNDIVAGHSLAVMVYHGTGLKRSFYRDISDRIDLRAVDCPLRWKDLCTQVVTNGVLAGYTKLDALADEKDKSAELAQKLGLEPNVQTILYAPTFYPSSLDKTLPYLPGIAEDLNVVIKLHHFSWFQQRYRYQSLKAAEIADRYSRIHLVPGEEYNILPYYPLADVLVSNISSTLFEFLALNRPIIKTEYYSLRLKHRIFPWRIRRRINWEWEADIDFANRLKTPSRLRELLAHTLQHPEEMKAKREQAVERYLYRLDGRSSSRLVDAIENMLQEQNRR
ncbi:MAG: CDP-glycerol glycerophosphotransferase family protein [Fidelibacterota bacterium]|nr:MAG: CDP-glycerol glycerophosphotransferase family protein [Candidatus Neomarinimicrobiota bacterium]